MLAEKPKIKFAKGALVRCTKTAMGNSFRAGEIYKVREDFYDTDAVDPYSSIKIEADSNGSTTNGWRQSCFEAFPSTHAAKKSAMETQVGGTHYTDMAIQPATYNLANGLGWAEGDAVSYISRWRAKGGLQDLRKARQTLLLLIEHEEALGTK